MSREVHVPFYERLGVQFPRPTHRFGVSFRDVEDLLAKSPGQAQRFLSVHGLVRNLFHVGRHLVPWCTTRDLGQ